MEKQVTPQFTNNDKFFRFQVYQAESQKDGSLKKTKSVGMAYLKEGQQTMTMRLWTFLNERFYLILNQNDASKYLIMTREPNKSLTSKNKYFWNIVGHGLIDTALGVVKLEFDLLDKIIFMNLHPESSAYSVSLPDPEVLKDAV